MAAMGSVDAQEQGKRLRARGEGEVGEEVDVN